MDTNARLDGFMVHPLDLFPTNKNLNDNANKITLNTANLDGFKVHPIDLFVSHDNSPFRNNNDNPPISNYKIFNTETNNNLNIVQYSTITNGRNILSQYQYPQNISSYKPSIKTTIIKKEITYNYPNISQNTSNYKNYNQNPANIKTEISYVPFPITNQQNKVTYPEDNNQNITKINYIQQSPIIEKKVKIIKFPRTTIQNITTTYENYSPTNNIINYREPYIQKYSYSTNNQPQTQPQIQPQIQPQQLLPQTQPQIQPQIQPQQLQPQPQPQLQPQIQPQQIQHQTQPQLQPQQLLPQTQPQIQPQIQPQQIPQPQPQFQTNFQAQPLPKPQLNSQPLIQAQLQHKPQFQTLPQSQPQTQPQQIKTTTIIYRNYPISNNNDKINYITPTKTKNIGINNRFDYSQAPKTTTNITNISYIKPQIQQYNLINQNQKIYELNNYNKNIILNLKKLPPTKIMNIDRNDVQSNNIFSSNTAQNNNIIKQNKGLSILNQVKTAPYLSKAFPYSTASYEPETTAGEYQTRTSLIGLKSYFDLTNKERMPRNKTPIKGIQQIGTTIIPTSNNIITPIKKSIIFPQNTTAIIPNITTNIFSTPKKSSNQFSPSKSPIITNQFSPTKSPIISSNFVQPVVTTKKIISNPRNNIVIPLSTIPLNTNSNDIYSLTSLKSQRAYNQGLRAINRDGNTIYPIKQNISIDLPSRQRALSKSPLKNNFLSYLPNQRNIVEINNLKLVSPIYTQRI